MGYAKDLNANICSTRWYEMISLIQYFPGNKRRRWLGTCDSSWALSNNAKNSHTMMHLRLLMSITRFHQIVSLFSPIKQSILQYAGKFNLRCGRGLGWGKLCYSFNEYTITHRGILVSIRNNCEAKKALTNIRFDVLASPRYKTREKRLSHCKIE